MTILINDVTAKRNITTIKTNGLKMDNLLHVTGLYCIDQVNQHGNTHQLNQLVSALGRNTRKEAFITWVRDHAKVVSLKTGVLEYRKDRKLYDANGIECTNEVALEKAESVPFWDYTKEVKPVSSYDVLTRLESLLKSAKSFAGDVKHAELLNTLQVIVDASKAGDTIELKEPETSAE